MGLETKVEGEVLKTKEDWYNFIKLDNSEERANILKKLFDEKRLTFEIKDSYDLLFRYIADGWGRYHNSGLVHDAYFKNKEDAMNFRDALVEIKNSRLIKGEEAYKKKDFAVIYCLKE